VAQTILIGLLGNTQITPVPYTDPKTGNEYYINVRMDDADRGHVADLKDLFVRTPANGIVSVDTLARIERRSGPVLIDRKYLQRIVHITANIAPDADLGGASEAVQHVVDETQVPDGFSATLGGQTLEQKKAFQGLIFAAIMALALVYMVLASQFKSLIDPLVIMFSVPLGISGVFIMLYLTGTKLSVNSFMGIIMMVGIVVSNGVLLVDFANVLRGRGKDLWPRQPSGWPNPAAPHLDDHHRNRHRSRSHGAWHRRGQRNQPAARSRGHRRSDGFDLLHLVPGAGALHAARPLCQAIGSR
jgi:multidrug efflux pump subunit AcrB